MFRALAGLKSGTKTPQDYKGPVRKTHSFDPRSFENAKRAIFLFGDPVAAVISTRKNRYGRRHFLNCGASDRDPETTDIFREDALNYEKMWHAWPQRQSFDLLCVRYEALYDHLNTIEEFFGRRLYLPPPKPRTTSLIDDVSALDLDAIRTTYANLIAAIDRAPDLTIWRKQC
ncbi:MAG: hypothetical protein HRT82_08785 [Henriciella sp.]|nr:hypothetical protein [Henriciella sp.]